MYYSTKVTKEPRFNGSLCRTRRGTVPHGWASDAHLDDNHHKQHVDEDGLRKHDALPTKRSLGTLFSPSQIQTCTTFRTPSKRQSEWILSVWHRIKWFARYPTLNYCYAKRQVPEKYVIVLPSYRYNVKIERSDLVLLCVICQTSLNFMELRGFRFRTEYKVTERAWKKDTTPKLWLSWNLLENKIKCRGHK